MKRWLWTAGAALLALGAGAQKDTRPNVPEQWRAGWDTISEKDASTLVHHLAGPEFNGRSAFTADFDRAAQWSAEWMNKNGISPGAPNGTYLQPFTMEYRSPDYSSLEVTVNGERVSFEKEDDLRFSAVANVDETIPVAFVRQPAGHPLTELDWAKMKDRIVIVHPDTPREDLTEINAAQRQSLTGARQIVMVSREGVGEGTKSRVIAELQDKTAPATNLRLSLDGARALARAADADLFAAQYMEKPSVEFGEFTLRAKVSRAKWYSTMNVVGKIPGSDPRLSKEALVIGAHLDHMGVERGATYWGADDNASGSSAALMIGRALAANPVKPKRTVIIALWSSEERGLFGSQMYAGRPSVPMEDTVAYFNMDMVGRDADFAPFGDKPEDNRNAIYIGSAEFSSPELYKFLKETNRYVGLNLRDDKNDRTRRSDTGSFYDKGVPVLKAFSGEHKDYHKPTDTPDKLNYPKMARVARWLYISAAELASANWRPSFDANAKMIVGKAEIDRRTNLSADCVFYATLIESNVDGSSPMVIDRTSQVQPGQAPISFALKYHTTRIDPHKLYVIRASIMQHGKVIYRTESGLRVLTYHHPADNVALKMTAR